MPLSQNELKQIKADAKRRYKDEGVAGLYRGQERLAYTVGATAQAEKYQSEVDMYETINGDLVTNCKHVEADLASRDSELRELREVANRMAEALEFFSTESDIIDNEYPLHSGKGREALAAYRKIKPEIKHGTQKDPSRSS